MVSVVLSTYNRGHLLVRSLEAYLQQHLDPDFEIVIVDDGSADDTGVMCKEYAKWLDLKYIRLHKPEGLWRDCAATINMGIRAAKGDLIICTHPEVIPGPCSLQNLWDNRDEKVYLACKVYYLTPDDQANLDTVPWRRNAPAAVRTLSNFYSQHSTEVNGNKDYTPQAMDQHTSWGSWVFGGFTKATWRWFGGFTEFAQWGSIDVDFLNRRSILGIPTYTALDIDSFVVHQNHDRIVATTDVLTPRDMYKAMQVPIYRSPHEALLHHI